MKLKMHRSVSLAAGLILMLGPAAWLPAAESAPGSLLDQYRAALPAAPAPAHPAPPAPLSPPTTVPDPGRTARADAGRLADQVRLRNLGIPEPVEVQARALHAEGEPAVLKILAAGPDLPLLLALVAVRNPAIQAAHANLLAERARYEQADYLEDLLRQYRGYVREIDTAVGPRRLPMDEGGLFTGSDVLTLKGAIIDRSIAIADLDETIAIRTALRAAAGGYFRLQAAHRTLELLQTNRLLAAQMNDSAAAQLQAGRVTQADVLKTRTLLELLDNRIAAQQQDAIPAEQARLNGLLQLPPDAPWGPLPVRDLPPSAPVAASVEQQFLSGNQELQRAGVEADRMATMRRMAGLMLAPGSSGAARIDLNSGAEAGPNRNMMTTFPDQPAAMPPPPEFSANLAYLQELAHRVNAMEAMQRDQRHTGAARADAQLHDLAQAARTLQTLDAAVPRAKQTFDLVKANYAAGNAPLVEFLDAGREYFDQTVMREDARRDLNLAWVALEDLLGRTVLAVPTAAAPAPAAPAAPAQPSALPGDPRP